MLPPFFSQIFCHKTQKVPMNVLIKQVEMLGVKKLHDLASFHIKSIPKWAENSGFLISNIWKYAVLYKERRFSAWDVFTINWSFYFSAHIVKHWKCWASNSIAIYHPALLSASLFLFYRTKVNRVKMQQGELFEVDPGREWEGGRESEPVNPVTPKFHHHNDKNELDCRGQCGMGKKFWVGQK